MDRRAFLVRSLTIGGVAVAGPTLLAACSSSTSTATPGAAGTTTAASSTTSAASSTATATMADMGTLDFRMSWVPNVEFAGEFIADNKGYYKAEGFSKVNLQAGGPAATPVETDLVQKKTFCGISAPDITGAAVAKGAPLKIIGAQYQKNPFCIMSLAKTPLKSPQDMVGKKIGVQATNESVWNAFLKANNIDPKSIHKVPVQFDPTPLTTGSVDGWFSFVTNEPNTLKSKGIDTVTFLLADFNYPLVSEVYVVRQETIDNERAKIKAMLRAEIKGWKDNVADPKLGATLAATQYGKDLKLDVAEQTLESTSENELISTTETKANGLFTITDALIAENIKTLKLAGIDLTADKLFDLSILKEVYSEDPSLKA
jgi:ABC-type nitrate/sulfonate/bicarbonate transport system substrate-binding protein